MKRGLKGGRREEGDRELRPRGQVWEVRALVPSAPWVAKNC